MFPKTDVAPKWIHNNLDLATAWALDRSISTIEAAAKRRRRLHDEMAKIGKEWFLSACFANDSRGKVDVDAFDNGQDGPSHDAKRGGTAPP
ncbi:Importin subunit beta-1 [Hordeum vulgare]|nr:Importin subunit beta-1 [Hordeum vulgare]